MWLLYAAAVVNGIANAGGVLAWNLGHHDFAPPHRDSQYMGVHVTLNGIRGIAAPFLAVAIYELLDNHGGGGAWVFAVCLVINTIGAAGFVWLNHLMRRSFKAGTDAPSIHRLTVH
jgi:MFS family permease